MWRLYARMDFLMLTRSMRLFLTWYLSDTLLNVAAVAAAFLLAERFDGIGPWSKYQVLFLLGYSTLVRGVLETFFSYNVLYISRRIGRGQLDHILIQPQPIWMTLLTEGFLPLSLSGVLMLGLGLTAWAGLNLGLSLSPAWLALFALNLAASCAVVVAFSYLWGSLAFWAPRAAEEISTPLVYMVYSLKAFPLDGLPLPMLGGLLSIVPIGFVAWFPCRALLGLDDSPLGGFITPLAALALGALAIWAFSKGLKQYGRTGSQRYHPLGHRS